MVYVTGMMEGVDLNPFSTPGFTHTTADEGDDNDACVAAIDPSHPRIPLYTPV